MVSVDTQKQFLWSQPHFKNKEEEQKHLYKRYVDYMTEEAIPAEPTRKQELDYLKWFAGSIAKDPIFTVHPRLHGPSPKRLYYKHGLELKKEYRKTFLKNFILSGLLAWPLTI